MIASAEEFVRLRASTDPQDYARAASEDAEEGTWLELVQSHPEMHFWVAQNKTVPTSILRLVAASADANARSMVARKRRTPPDVLGVLALDSCESVRLAVAGNPKTPMSVLDALCRDSWSEVARLASERLAARREQG